MKLVCQPDVPVPHRQMISFLFLIRLTYSLGIIRECEQVNIPIPFPYPVDCPIYPSLHASAFPPACHKPRPLKTPT